MVEDDGDSEESTALNLESDALKSMIIG